MEQQQKVIDQRDAKGEKCLDTDETNEHLQTCVPNMCEDVYKEERMQTNMLDNGAQNENKGTKEGMNYRGKKDAMKNRRSKNKGKKREVDSKLQEAPYEVNHDENYLDKKYIEENNIEEISTKVSSEKVTQEDSIKEIEDEINIFSESKEEEIIKEEVNLEDNETKENEVEEKNKEENNVVENSIADKNIEDNKIKTVVVEIVRQPNSSGGICQEVIIGAQIRSNEDNVKDVDNKEVDRKNIVQGVDNEVLCNEVNPPNERNETQAEGIVLQSENNKKQTNTNKIHLEMTMPQIEKAQQMLTKTRNYKYEEYSPNKRFARLGTVIGHGSQKLVYKAIDHYDAKEVAWNVLESVDCPEAFSEEINLLKSIQHPNIIKMKEFWFTSEHVIFITELMTSGTLREYIKNIKPTLRIIRNWSTQILSAIEHLHEKSMIHRDIKCENIFVNGSTGELKVGDLGISKQGRQRRYTIIGTPEFMAREVFEGDGYGEGVDIYAFGMALLEISTRDYPYHECSNAHDVFKRIMSGIPPESLFKVKNACLRHLIVKCLAPENERFNVKQCLAHHFIVNDTLEDEAEKNSESASAKSKQPSIGCKECLLFHQEYAFPNIRPPTDTSLSMISYRENILYLQLYYKDLDRFIKFDFDILNDSVDSISSEMIREKVFPRDKYDWLIDTMITGLAVIKAGIIKNNNVTHLIKAWANDEAINKEMLEIKKSMQEKLLNQPSKHEADKQRIAELENTQTDENSEQKPVILSTGNESTDSLKLEVPATPILTDLDFPNTTYLDEMLIDEFVRETATVTKRDDNTALSWIKTIKSQELRTVGDLRILVDEDWSFLGLTVFSSRAMKNMLYGKDKQPCKEKDLTANSYSTYGDETTIEDFVLSVKTLIERNGTTEWKDKLLRQDVRSVGELKSLTVGDWEKLELSVFGSRVIKNVVFGRGKITRAGRII